MSLLWWDKRQRTRGQSKFRTEKAVCEGVGEGVLRGQRRETEKWNKCISAAPGGERQSRHE